MRNESEINGLLDDVFEELAPPSFRAELFGNTLKEARRRNHARRRNQTFLTLAAVALIGLLVWKVPAPRIVPQRLPLSGLATVHSAPLAPSEVVETIPGSAQIIGSSPSTVTFVETQSSVPELNDAELLALMDGTPSVLVRKGPHEEELLVVDASTSTARPVDDTYERDMPNP